MSRDLNHLASLNTVDNDNSPHEEQKRHEEELQMFSNTTFFDLDMGRSTDIATTVDELLMQQEKQIQYPHKQQPCEDGPVAGPSYSSEPRLDLQLQQQQQQPSPALDQRSQSFSAPTQPPPQSQQQSQPRSLPFDFSTLQGFSLAGELPQASLSIYDVDPMFHEQAPAPQHQSTQQIQAQVPPPSQHAQPGAHQHQHQHSPALHEDFHLHHVSRPPLPQRHEVSDQYGPPLPPQGQRQKSLDESAALPRGSPHDSLHDSLSMKSLVGLDDEKRRRNTAASARFRVKKKMREQEMEKNQRLMQQRLADQEERIKQLEMENSWLKNLVVEKNTARDSSSLGRLRQELLLQEGKR